MEWYNKHYILRSDCNAILTNHSLTMTMYIINNSNHNYNKFSSTLQWSFNIDLVIKSQPKNNIRVYLYRLFHITICLHCVFSNIRKNSCNKNILNIFCIVINNILEHYCFKNGCVLLSSFLFKSREQNDSMNIHRYYIHKIQKYIWLHKLSWVHKFAY